MGLQFAFGHFSNNSRAQDKGSFFCSSGGLHLCSETAGSLAMNKGESAGTLAYVSGSEYDFSGLFDDSTGEAVTLENPSSCLDFSYDSACASFDFSSDASCSSDNAVV